MEEYEVVNYTDEDSFESFCKKNKGKILKKLKGKKMKTRLLRNARKLLDESTDLPAPEKNNILMGAIEDTVNESESEGFEGEEFDHFRFAKNVRKKAEQKMNRPIPKVSIKNIFNKKKTIRKIASSPAVIAQNGQLAAPTNPNKSMHPNLDLTKPIDRPGYSATGKEPVTAIEDKKAPKLDMALNNQATKAEKDFVVPAEEKKAIQEAKAETVASNGQLSFPKEFSGGSETPIDSEEPAAQTETTTASSPGAGEANKEQATATEKTTETKPEEKKNASETKKGIDKKWFWGGGIVAVIILIIILVFALKK